jgi:malate dehydrogenase (oxaloacetate-decarboxylating)(NADP+)
MKLAAAEALCEVASMKVDADTMEELAKAYPADAANGMFDGDNPLKLSYVIPKPFDPRVVPHVARKVAEAAMKTGMAKMQIEDLDAYEKSVRARVKANL